MVVRYGMDADLGNVSYEAERSSFLGDRTPGYFERNYSEATAEAVDTAVRELLSELSEQAYEILSHNRDILERAARRLLDVETLDQAALRELAQGLLHGVQGEVAVDG